MQHEQKNRKEVLDKLHIASLNEMQEAATLAIEASENVLLLSPTGTGKTLAFLLPTLFELNPEIAQVQMLIIVPTRELATQIEQVARNMGLGLKIHSAYGGQSFNTDRQALKQPPALLIGTPGRIADHLRRTTFDTSQLKTLVLDEFDKSLEIGFESEMKEILRLLPSLEHKILTSATQGVHVPSFVDFHNPTLVDYLHTAASKLELKSIVSPEKDKLHTLIRALCHLGNVPGIIFLNYKDAIHRVSEYLEEHGIAHGCFYGGMEQQERELALLKFRNGTHQTLLATDLAARGIDIPELAYIIHYQLPHRKEEFTHRNGRTARMHADGIAYVLHWRQEPLPDFIPKLDEEYLHDMPVPVETPWKTIHISAGRTHKISKGDIAGLFFKQGGLTKDQLGTIELKRDRSYVAVAAAEADNIVQKLDHSRLKKVKVRITLV